MKFVISFLLLCVGLATNSQNKKYTVSNAHSHNDYEQANPFYEAYNAGFGSIEADIFLVNDELIVAHDTKEVLLHRTLDSMYLQPLQKAIEKNKGVPYPKNEKLQLLVDIKTDSIATIKRLLLLLQKYPAIIRNKNISVVLTGNLPAQTLFTGYPTYISFDGVLQNQYSPAALSRIAMMSDDFKVYSNWKGKDTLPQTDLHSLQHAIAKAHQLHKKVRFWDAPDNENAWTQFENLGVDFINTDHIKQLAFFLSK